MSFKDYFSSDLWFNEAQGHLLNMALKDYNDKGAKRYIVKEYFMSGVGVFCGAIIYGISSMIGKINLKTFSSFVVSLWDHTVGLLFNSVSDDNSAADTAPPNAKLAGNADTY